MGTSDLGRQPLGALDLCLLRHSQAVQDMGGGGLTQQVQVWLRSRVDPTGLRAALARLSAAYPVVTARLVEEPRKGRAHWQFRPGAACPLYEVWVKEAGEAAALRHAACILSAAAGPPHPRPLSPEAGERGGRSAPPLSPQGGRGVGGEGGKSPAVQFHLLHLADGRDLFLMQYDHCLMDFHGARELLREINRLSKGLPPTGEAPGRDDAIRAHLGRFSFRQRWPAVWRFGRRFRAIERSQPVTLADAAETAGSGPFRIAVRELSATQTEAFLARTRRLRGLPSPATVLLASVFRGILRHSPRPVPEGAALVTHAGTNLRGRGEQGPSFCNLGSLLSLVAHPEDMGERDNLIRLLNRQLRDQLGENADLALLQWAWWLRRCAGWWRRHARKTLRQLSLDYAYLGRLVEEGDCFAGVPVERLVPVSQVWPPAGLALAPAICRGRLILPATYRADLVPDARLHAFLDTVIADLGAETPEPLLKMSHVQQ